MGKFLRLTNGIPKSYDEAGSVSIYDQTTELLVAVSSGTSISLPLSKTYTGAELEVYLNGLRVSAGIDYDYESSTQISFNYDLGVGTLIKFRIDRSA